MGRRGQRVKEYSAAGGSALDVGSISDALSDILEGYADEVFYATESGLDMAETILIRNMKAASPKGKGGFEKSWKGSQHKYKLVRFVGNTKNVRSKGRNIPLINIFEYSATNHAHPFVKQTFESSIPAMVSAITEEIKK